MRCISSSAWALLVVAGLSTSGCGSGGGETTPNEPPGDSPVVFPTDFGMPYVADDGIHTVSAIDISSVQLRSPERPSHENMLLAIDSEYSDGISSNSRPYGLVFLSGTQWKLLPLRNGLGPAAIGPAETRPVCFLNGVLPDFAAPERSLVLYQRAGPAGDCANDEPYEGALFRMDSLSAPLELGELSGVPRVFRNRSNGAITGALIQIGNELRLYSPALDSHTVVATDLASSPTALALTDTTRWLSWKDGSGVPRIYRITANGTASILYTAPSAGSLSVAATTASTMYVRFRDAGSSASQIIRIPFSGAAASVLYASDTSIQPRAFNTNAIVFEGIAADTGMSSLLLLPLAGGPPVKLLPTAPRSEVFASNKGHFFFNDLRQSDNVYRAVIVDSQGRDAGSVNNAEWVGSTVAPATDFTTPIPNIGLGEMTTATRIEGISPSSRDAVGHQGGKVVTYNFGSGVQTELLQIDAPVLVESFFSSLPVDLTRIRQVEGLGLPTTADVVAFDFPGLKVVQVTSTPDSDEILP